MSWRARACNVAIRHGLRASLEGAQFNKGVARFGRRMELASALLPLPWSVSHDSVRLAGVPCHWLAHARPGDASAVVVYLHGGGFVTGSPRTHRDTAWRLARAAHARVLLVDYRLAPAHPFPAARDDVLAVLEQLLQSGVPASRIALAGDSAGGNLALSAALHLVECGRSPAALVLFSPWLDLAPARMQPPLEHMLTADFLRGAAAAYAGGHEARDSRISPLHADLRGLPPLHACVAAGEMLQADAVELVARARAADVDARLREYPGQAHAFPTFAAVNPEARAALEEAGTFLRAHFDASTAASERELDCASIARLGEPVSPPVKTPFMEEQTMPVRPLHAALLDAGCTKIRRGRCEFLRIASPGSRIDAALQARLLAEFNQLTDAIYRADTSHYWKARTDYFDYVDELWTLHLDGEFIGWTGVKWLPFGTRRILYVDTLNARPRALRSGAAGYTLGMMLVHEYILICFRRMRPTPCAFRTQNPTVYRLAQAASKASVFPAVGPEARDREGSLRVAQAVADHVSPGRHFDVDCSVIRNAYGRSLYGASSLALRAVDPALAGFWRANLDTAAGDALVIVVRPTRREAWRALGRYFSAIALDRIRSATAVLWSRITPRGERGRDQQPQ